MKKIIAPSFLFVFLFLGISVFSQEKKKFSNIDYVLGKIVPSTKVDFWVLVNNKYGKNREVKVSGTKQDYLPQFVGFNFRPGEESFYYIVCSVGGKISYLTDQKELKEFIGKVDNAEEAALLAVLDGYLIDEQFVDIAANYYDDKTNYYLDLGKVTSKECPYQKTHFTLTVNKSTGIVSNIKDNGTYIEVYTKNCTNNPRLLKIEKKEEPKNEPQKQPSNKRK
ncbi:hypothetical protein AB670_01378 [Chryseobacterium sp. MOF25P]|uniref:hypothetical protein n=1 Tax=unclassified Chryseobacterium TaxID=2593645 RepID=UPI0008048E75|nr:MULTISPECIES: hypothetical protein [unclassified Chryseobacterium]OBW42312.1 hypothetical protein AB670_01378 [Chryseobacterium sp. MOF25P]OBW46775.1 hypothetical protein AB671_01025 [Chryseobacterium sp. BGARF1]